MALKLLREKVTVIHCYCLLHFFFFKLLCFQTELWESKQKPEVSLGHLWFFFFFKPISLALITYLKDQNYTLLRKYILSVLDMEIFSDSFFMESTKIFSFSVSQDLKDL